MALRFFNTLRRKKQLFVPRRRGHIRLYTCGPTVWDFAHIGNFRAYVFQDVLRRYLKYRGFKVTQVMNITDVEDKTIRGAREEGLPLADFTAKYTKAFFEDAEALRIERAEFFPRATEHVPDMVRLIRRLLRNGHAYRLDGSIYYDISSFRNYGKLSGVKIRELKRGARIDADVYTKDEAQDFALWKAWDEEDGDVFWETELGKGRPGWHIECSAMSMKYLGQSFDIHTGGEDLIFPHHENEIAQSEAATGKPFVKYWLHCGMLLINGEKMSKSLGNYYTLRDLLAKGYSAKAIRYLFMSAHYRAQLNFTEDSLRNAEKTVGGLHDFVNRVSGLETTTEYNAELHRFSEKVKREFVRFMDDDLDTPKALATLFSLVHTTNRAIAEGKASTRNLREIHDLIMRFNEVLAIFEPERLELTAEMKALIDQREQARKRKDWETADKIRAQLLTHGIELEDTPYGVIWKKARR